MYTIVENANPEMIQKAVRERALSMVGFFDNKMKSATINVKIMMLKITKNTQVP
jgi:hypothetical protein